LFRFLKKTNKSGVQVDPREISMAFQFFDSAGKGSINEQDLKEKLSIFNQNLTARECKLLLQNKVCSESLMFFIFIFK
jgi:Ca2+-binding EF-hand superfamily protein